jgi:hypothetical protein
MTVCFIRQNHGGISVVGEHTGGDSSAYHLSGRYTLIVPQVVALLRDLEYSTQLYCIVTSTGSSFTRLYSHQL